MRRLPILLVFALMFVLLALSPASAGKPNCDDPESHPSCKADDPPPATTPPCTDEILTGITGNGRVGVECLWTPAADVSVEGTVTVTPNRAISSLVVFVRDSSPGDICMLEQPGKADAPFVASFDLAYGELAEPDGWDPYNIYPNFSDWTGQNYWDFSYEGDGAHWCYPQDGVQGMREDLNGKPLHVNVGWIAKKNTTVDVALFPAQEG